MIPVAFPIFSDGRRQSPQCRKRTNYWALVIFAITALAGFAIQHLPG